jgi:hypothetical protein
MAFFTHFPSISTCHFTHPLYSPLPLLIMPVVGLFDVLAAAVAVAYRCCHRHRFRCSPEKEKKKIILNE